MAGNVLEWVADFYGDYPSGAQTNPAGPTTGAFRVLRGGSFDLYLTLVRVADRGSSYPDARYNGIGFRCAGSALGQ